MIAHLRDKQIDTGIHFVPVHKHTWFADAPCGDMSVTDKVVEQVLTLPLHSNMRPEFVERVIDGVTSFFD
jgi:dTDP-4-amino-4,6-dideoxygalactose transaminase